MPPIMTFWKNERNDSWYDKARIFLVQFSLHMLTGIIFELNKLNKKFQEEYVDVSYLGEAIDVTIKTLRRWFLRNDTFVDGTCYLYKFLDASQFGYLDIYDKEGLVHRHEV